VSKSAQKITPVQARSASNFIPLSVTIFNLNKVRSVSHGNFYYFHPRSKHQFPTNNSINRYNILASETLKTLLIGVGNPLRGDDGIGQWICEQAAKWKLQHLHIKTMQQLTIDLLEELQNFSAVVIADASEQKAPATLEEVDGSENGYASSHHADAATLRALHRNLYQQSTVWHSLGIKASKFEMGQPISKETLANGAVALQLLKQHLTKKTED
jgi:hydrogenase maturation protease